MAVCRRCVILWDFDKLDFLGNDCDKFAKRTRFATIHLRASAHSILTIIKNHFDVVIESRSHRKELKRPIKSTS